MKMLARWKEGLFWRSESVTPWWIIPAAETDWPTRTGKPSVPTGALLLRVRTRYRIGKQYQKDLALASWQKGGSGKPAWVVELSETEHGKYFPEGIGSVAVYQRPLYGCIVHARVHVHGPRWTWASFISHFLSPRRFSKRPAAMPSAMRRWPPLIVM